MTNEQLKARDEKILAYIRKHYKNVDLTFTRSRCSANGNFIDRFCHFSLDGSKKDAWSKLFKFLKENSINSFEIQFDHEMEEPDKGISRIKIEYAICKC